MSSLGKITLTGASGRQYEFEVYDFGVVFAPVAAVYVVTRFDFQRQHWIVYIGQTGNLPQRFDSHHKAACFKRHNANRICVHLDNNENSRLAKEGDLIARYNPPCNG